MSMQTHAQFTLEHIYDSTGYFQTSKDAMGNIRYGKQLFYLVNLEIDGDKYVQINESAQTIKFYNLNHTFWKTISYSNVTTNICPNSLDKTNNSILYISQSLFNTDAKIEFMYTCSWNYSADTSWKAITQIVNEDDSILFTDTAAAPLVVPTWANQYYPIYNTTNGTKMILSNVTGKAEVYSLAGTLTDGIAEANKKLMAMQSSVSNAYPNPNNGSAKIDYSLPPSINEGEIVFYNLQGTEVKRFKVDRTFNTLLISTKDIAAGTYYYQLQTAGESSGGKKMVVIK
ncbi:MAG: T9SS type A sorting domain-containing protein [Bacteroidales bacterium]